MLNIHPLIQQSFYLQFDFFAQKSGVGGLDRIGAVIHLVEEALVFQELLVQLLR